MIGTPARPQNSADRQQRLFLQAPQRRAEARRLRGPRQHAADIRADHSRIRHAHRRRLRHQHARNGRSRNRHDHSAPIPKTPNLPIIALGDGSQRALMEAFQAGCDDYIDRRRPPAVIASHIRNIIISKAEGFQPTQMLAQADTSLSGSLTHHDLPGVLQMLGHAHQTGALHINAGATDAVLFFDAGDITHAECGSLFGDEAVIHIVKSCIRGEGVYKFVYGATTPRSHRAAFRNRSHARRHARVRRKRAGFSRRVAARQHQSLGDARPQILSQMLRLRSTRFRSMTQETSPSTAQSNGNSTQKFNPNSSPKQQPIHHRTTGLISWSTSNRPRFPNRTRAVETEPPIPIRRRHTDPRDQSCMRSPSCERPLPISKS